MKSKNKKKKKRKRKKKDNPVEALAPSNDHHALYRRGFSVCVCLICTSISPKLRGRKKKTR